MTPFKRFSSLPNVKNIVKNTTYALTISGGLLFGLGCGSNTEYTTEEVIEPTQGLITKVKEVETDQFKITDEITVPAKDDSRIIATYLTGVVDTFTLAEAQLVDASNPKRSMMRSVLLGGLMGYYMGKSMRTPTSASSYVDSKTHKKVNSTAGSNMQKTAKRTSVRKPKAGSSGYGKKSTKSYGG